MQEKEIEKILVSEVKKIGGRAYKFVSPGNDGVPDRIVILPNQWPIFVELKTERGRLSSLQKVQLFRLNNLGQRVNVVKGMSGLIEFFDGYGYPEVALNLKRRYMRGDDDGI